MKEWNAVIRKGMLFLAAAFLCLLAIPQKASAVEVNKIEIGSTGIGTGTHLSAEKPAYLNDVGAWADIEYVKSKGGAYFENGKLYLVNYEGPYISAGNSSDGKPFYIVLCGSNKIIADDAYYGIRTSGSALVITTEGEEDGSLEIQVTDAATGNVDGIDVDYNSAKNDSVFIQKNADVSVNVQLSKNHGNSSYAYGIYTHGGDICVQDHAKLNVAVSSTDAAVYDWIYGVYSDSGRLDISTDQDVLIDASGTKDKSIGVWCQKKMIKLANTKNFTVKAKNTETFTTHLLIQNSSELDIAGYYYDPNTHNGDKNAQPSVTYVPMERITLERAVFTVSFNISTNYLKLGPPYGTNVSDCKPTFGIYNVTYTDPVTGEKVIKEGKDFPVGKAPLVIENGKWQVLDEVSDTWIDAVGTVTDGIYRYYGTVKALDVNQVKYDVLDNMVIGIVTPQGNDRIEWTRDGVVDRTQLTNNAQFDGFADPCPRTHSQTMAYNVNLKGVKIPAVGTKVSDQLSGISIVPEYNGTQMGDTAPYFYESNPATHMDDTAVFAYNKGYHLVVTSKVVEEGGFSKSKFADADKVEIVGLSGLPVKKVTKNLDSTRKVLTIDIEFEKTKGSTVTFDPNNGSEDPVAISYQKGTWIEALPDPADTELGFTAPAGKIFGGWKVAEGDIKKAGDACFVQEDAMTIKAVWVDDTWKIYFKESESAEVHPDAIYYTVVKGENFVLPILYFSAPEGQEFDRWQWEADGVKKTGRLGEEVEIKGDTTMWPLWKKTGTCSVTFDANGGSGEMAFVIVDEGASYKLPECTFTAPAGKEFAVWDMGDAGTSITVDTDVVVTAFWKNKPADSTEDNKGGADGKGGSGSGSESGNGKGSGTSETVLPAAGTSVTPADGTGVYTVSKIEEDELGNTIISVTFDKPVASAGAEIRVPSVTTLEGGRKARVSAIAKDAFAGNTTVTRVIIGKNVESVGENAFKDCANLKNVDIEGNTLTTIAPGAFMNCKKLKKIVIGEKVTTIGKNAFNGCKKLKTILIKSQKLTKKKTGKAAFKNIHKKAVFTLPEDLSNKKRTAYKALLKKANKPATAKIK